MFDSTEESDLLNKILFKKLIKWEIKMNQITSEDTTLYKVVINHEEQYSIWPADKENALGWRDVGKSGLKSECLEYIKKVWTDMRPLSLKKQMEETASKN